MKFIHQLLCALALGAAFQAAQSADVEIDNRGDDTTVTVIIEPGPGSVGRTVNVWISAVHNDVAYFHNGAAWVPYAGGPMPVAVRGRVLAASNKLPIARGADITSLPGADLYVGYGATEEEMNASEGKLTKVATIGRKFQWPAPRAR